MNQMPCALHMGESLPDVKAHKLEYDTQYESSPERVKYREELNRERRKRGIYGHGGPDMSHTKDHTLVAEDPHENRARHFKERGTLKSLPMNIAWGILKANMGGGIYMCDECGETLLGSTGMIRHLQETGHQSD